MLGAEGTFRLQQLTELVVGDTTAGFKRQAAFVAR